MYIQTEWKKFKATHTHSMRNNGKKFINLSTSNVSIKPVC